MSGRVTLLEAWIAEYDRRASEVPARATRLALGFEWQRRRREALEACRDRLLNIALERVTDRAAA